MILDQIIRIHGVEMLHWLISPVTPSEFGVFMMLKIVVVVAILYYFWGIWKQM